MGPKLRLHHELRERRALGDDPSDGWTKYVARDRMDHIHGLMELMYAVEKCNSFWNAMYLIKEL